MEKMTRRLKPIQDQENLHVIKAKGSAMLPTKRHGLAVRGALGDLNTNVQAQREIVGKVAVAAAEFEKKATHNRVVNKSNYSHVQSKVDTGLVVKSTVQPTMRPPLRREESTANLAARAAAKNRVLLKNGENKSDIRIYITKKENQINKNKLPVLKEYKEKSLKPILKQSTVSLEKLKLAETSVKPDKTTSKTVLPDLLKFNVSIPNVPEDIEDIDAGDNNNPLLMSIYIKDIYHYLTELELKYPIEYDHLRKQSVITGNMRATLINWLVEVQEQFTLVLETFQLAVGILDRYLQVVPDVPRDRLQLVGVTAMFIASKYEEIYAPEVGDFVYITKNAYTKREVFQCEREIMSKLDFCLARPVPLSFLRRFVKAADGTSKNHHLAKYLIDLSLVEYSMTHYRPSELAAAAICLSIHLLSNKSLEEVWTPTLSYYSGYTLQNIDPIIRKLAKIVINVEHSKYKAVYNKYLDPNLAKVSSLPQLRSEIVCELAKSPPSS